MTPTGRYVVRVLTAAALATGAGGCGVHAPGRATATDVCVGALPVTRSLVGPQATLRHPRVVQAQVRQDVPRQLAH